VESWYLGVVKPLALVLQIHKLCQFAWWHTIAP
jgi:hypothetical protein